jgi:hypothetical protein
MSEIERLKADIKSLSDEIAMKVDADNVIGAINVSREEVRIKGDKIQIDQADFDYIY